MNDARKTKAQLLEELAELRQRIVELESPNTDFSEERYRLLAENVTDMISRHSPTGDYLDVTASCYVLLGYEPEELIGHNAYDFIHPDDFEAVRESQNTILNEEQTFTVEYRLRHKKGHYIWTESISHVVAKETDAPYILVVTRNITERKATEEELRKNIAERKRTEKIFEENQMVLQATLESMQDGLLVVTEDGIVSHYNSQFCRMWSIPENLASTENDPALVHYVLPQLVDPEQFTARIEALYHTSEISEDILYLKDGRLFERMSYPLIREGQEKGRVWLFRDITERKQAEEALRLNSFALERAADAIYWIRHTQILDVNEAACNMLGYSHEEFRDMSVTNIDPAMPKTNMMSGWERLKKEGSTIIESLHKTKDGRIVPVEIMSNYIAFEGKEFNCCFVRDITHRKQSEEALRQSEERLRQAIHVGAVGIFDHDHIQNTIYMSAKYNEILGLAADEPVTLEKFTAMIHPDDVERVAQTVQHAHSPTGDSNFHIEHRVIDRSGAVHWLSVRAYTYFKGEGSDRYPIRTIGAIADITQHKQMEQQRLELALEKERSDTLRMLIGNISHDIKTPLAIINTSLYLLEKVTNPQKRQEKMDNIKGQVRALENFIQDLLALSRLDGNPILHLTPVDVNQLVLDIEAETQPLTEQKQIAFTLDLAEDMTPIQADQADLRRALTNLVENALNYTPTGHTVTVRTRKQARTTLVEVADTGMGICEDELPHIFDRFYRSTQAKAISSSGSGLGLAIVKRIIEMHGGVIDVTSKPGTGTTFYVRLPIV